VAQLINSNLSKFKTSVIGNLKTYMLPTMKKIIPAQTLVLLMTKNYIKVKSAYEARQDGALNAPKSKQ